MIQPLSPAQSLQRELLLPRSATYEAGRGWARITEAIRKGFQKSEQKRHDISDLIELRDRYSSLSRYCDDAQRLISFHANPRNGESVELFAIDPHLLTAYSEPWHDGAHTGFRFFRTEGTTWSDVDRRFPVFTYAGVFRATPAIILDAGRAELSTTLAHFTDSADKDIHHDQNNSVEHPFNQFLDELEQAFGEKAQAATDHTKAFDRLVLAGGEPELRQHLALARLVGVMKRETFLGPEMAIRLAFKDHHYSTNVEKLSILLRYLRNNPAFLNQVKRQFDEAYKLYRKNTYLSDTKEHLLKTDEIVLREGERFDLAAIIELHVLNTCLQIAGLPAQINYVTLSQRLFSFIQQYDRTVMRTPLLHPRSAIMFHDSNLFRTHKDEMARVVGGAIAFGRSIPDNGEITFAELDRFEKDLGDTLLSTRDTFLHSLADSPEERASMVDAINMVFERGTDSQRTRWHELRHRLSTRLEDQVNAVGQTFRSASVSMADRAWLAYESFAIQEGRDSEIDVLVRRFTDSRLRVDRLVILPIGGSYRYMFSIHNEVVAKRFANIPGDSFVRHGLKDLLQQVERCTEELDIETIQGRKGRALRYYVRALFAASHGQWSLAESLSSQADGSFYKRDLTIPHSSSVDLMSHIRAIQCKQEILFLRHLCRRALGYGSSTSRAKKSLLRRAGEDLLASATLTLMIERKFAGYKSLLDPVSVRQALAALALQVEWFSVQSNPTAAAPLALLPPTARDDIAWHGLQSVQRNAAFHPNFLHLDAKEMAKRLDASLTEVLDMGGSHHSPMSWRYLLLRAHSISLMLEASVDGDILPHNFLNRDRQTAFRELAVIARHWEAHRAWEEGYTKDAVGLPGRLSTSVEMRSHAIDHAELAEDAEFHEVPRAINPFLRALLSSSNIRLRCQSGIDEARYLVGPSGEMFASFSSLVVHGHYLDPFGFPRRVIQAVEKKYAPLIIAKLNDEYLEEELIDVDVFGPLPA